MGGEACSLFGTKNETIRRVWYCEKFFALTVKPNLLYHSLFVSPFPPSNSSLFSLLLLYQFLKPYWDLEAKPFDPVHSFFRWSTSIASLIAWPWQNLAKNKTNSTFLDKLFCLLIHSFLSLNYNLLSIQFLPSLSKYFR